MAKYWKLMGEYDAETQAYSAFAVAGRASPYRPVEDARLIGLRAIVNRTTAATLTSHVVFRLTSTSFEPNSIEVGAQGGGLQTAPAVPTPVYDFAVDQKVLSGVDIILEGLCIGASDVTNSVLLYGLFENSKR